MAKNKHNKDEEIKKNEIEVKDNTKLDAEEVQPETPEEPKQTDIEGINIETPEEAPAPLEPIAPMAKKSGFKAFVATKKGKVILALSSIIVVLAVLYAIPATRYGILGMFLTKDVHVMVVDSSTKKPVTKATISVGGKEAITDNSGEATIPAVPVGEYTLRITKKYYKDNETAYTVPIFEKPQDVQSKVVATGRQVTVVVTNKITHDPVGKATVTVKDTSATTDDKGVAIIVLPADQKSLPGTIKYDGYNQADVTINVTDVVDANKLAITPAGTLFYLSKQTGKINVMKSDLDGVNAKVVVAGTGNEIDASTLLLAARDWKFMALSAKRDNAKVGQLYLVDATTGKLSTIDEGDATFQLVGWSGHRFIYQVNRNNKQIWDDKRQSLKSFDADSGKITTLDETIGTGTNYFNHQAESLQNPYILEGKIVYSKAWTFGDSAAKDKPSAIMSVNPDGSQKQRAKEFSVTNSIAIESKLYAPQEIFFRVSIDNNAAVYYEYDSGVKSVANNDDKFYNTFYPTYLVSPTGKSTLWYEPRDGKNVIFVGDKDGKNTNEITKQSDFVAYGWYTDKYILLSKNESELYIAASDKAFATQEPLKVANYHKPAIKLAGYGYGYGGQ